MSNTNQTTNMPNNDESPQVKALNVLTNGIRLGSKVEVLSV